MYFLDGERIYIKPAKGLYSAETQYTDCIEQVRVMELQDPEHKKVFKLNFFVDTASTKSYCELLQKISTAVPQRLHPQIILNFIAQPPLTCKVIAEAFFYDPSKWEALFAQHENQPAICFDNKKIKVLIGNIQSHTNKGAANDSKNAFTVLKELLRSFDMPVSSLIRQWNYLEDILGYDNGKQRYQEFNNIRGEFYAGSFDQEGYPAATGIGMNRGGVIIEFVAVKSSRIRSVPVDNPDQIAAHAYSRNVLVGEGQCVKSAPMFERARYCELEGKKMIFISGTASIRGEETVGINDPEMQTQVTIGNIKKLYSPEMLAKLTDKPLQPQYGHARVYIKNKHDFALVRRTFRKNYGNLPVVYLVADICRSDLLVEIEGKVILE